MLLFPAALCLKPRVNLSVTKCCLGCPHNLLSLNASCHPLMHLRRRAEVPSEVPAQPPNHSGSTPWAGRPWGLSAVAPPTPFLGPEQFQEVRATPVLRQ